MDVERILVPVDGSELAEDALPLAMSLAARAGAALRLVHVRDRLHPIYIDGLPVVDESLHPLPDLHERTYLSRLRDRLEASDGVKVEAVILEGRIARTLAHHAKQVECVLIVMTTHGYGGLERFWLGSVADRLVRLSEVPLLLHKPSPTPEHGEGFACERILVLLDGSERAEKILGCVEWIAKTMGATVQLREVVEPARDSHDGDGAPVSHAEAQRYLREIADRLATSGVQASTHIEQHGEPASAILDHAREAGADLIALTTRGRGGVQRMLLGSVSDKVLRGTEVPLLLFRPKN